MRVSRTMLAVHHRREGGEGGEQRHRHALRDDAQAHQLVAPTGVEAAAPGHGDDAREQHHHGRHQGDADQDLEQYGKQLHGPEYTANRPAPPTSREGRPNRVATPGTLYPDRMVRVTPMVARRAAFRAFWRVSAA